MRTGISGRINIILAAVALAALGSAGAAHAAEFETTDRLAVNGYAQFKSSAEVRGLLGISTGVPYAALDVVSTGTADNTWAQIWRNSGGVEVASMTSTGKLYATLAVSGAGDNLGNHTATQQLNMGSYAIWSSSDITAAHFQINGSTVLAMPPGSGNLALGVSAGRSNTTGSNNNFLGSFSGVNNTTGFSNNFIGYLAASRNTTGSNNVFIGHYAGSYNDSGMSNTIVGSEAGYYTKTGYANAILGARAGGGGSVANYSFSSSTVMGYQAGYKLGTGANGNIVLGYQAGYNIATGTGNIVIGYADNTSAPAASNELVIGEVLFGKLDEKTIGISTRNPQAALDIVSTGTADNTWAQIWRNSGGVEVASMTSTGKLYATLAVSGAGDNLGNHTATQQLNMGSYALWSSSDITAAHFQIGGGTVLSVTGGGYSVAVGTEAGRQSTGDGNNFVGAYAGYYNTTGGNNNFQGYNSGKNNTIGASNTFVGSQSGYYNTIASYNTFVGYDAGKYNSTADKNAYVGYGAGDHTSAGTGNAILGAEAGYGVTGNSFSSSTLVGYRAGYAVTTGGNNTLLGFRAGDTLTTGTGNIIIGYDQDVPAAATNNYLNIGGALYGDLSAGNIGIGVTQPTAKLQVQGYSAGNYTVYATTSATAGVYSVAVTSTGVTNINNLVIENRTSDPVAPVTGQIWLRVN